MSELDDSLIVHIDEARQSALLEVTAHGQREYRNFKYVRPFMNSDFDRERSAMLFRPNVDVEPELKTGERFYRTMNGGWIGWE